MNKERFKESEIPYGVLAKFGLTQVMIEDLPVGNLEAFYSGQRTPLLPIQVIDDGEIVRARTRIQLVRTENGVDVMFYPELVKCNIDKFSNDDKAQLEQGKPVIGMIELADGKQIQGFYQLDKATKQLLSVPTPVIGRNIQLFCDKFHLNSAEINCVKAGEPLTIMSNDELITIGIDLDSPTGVRVCLGDDRKWKEYNKTEYNKYNFGAFGCWVMDEDGAMDYVPEEQYDDEMWDEMKKKNPMVHSR